MQFPEQERGAKAITFMVNPEEEDLCGYHFKKRSLSTVIGHQWNGAIRDGMDLFKET